MSFQYCSKDHEVIGNQVRSGCLSLKPGMVLSMLMYSVPEQESQLFISSLLLISEVYNGVM